MKSYLKEKPKCLKCNCDMILDDVDYNFEGNQDEYWICPKGLENPEKCQNSVFVKIRYGKVAKFEFSKGDQ